MTSPTPILIALCAAGLLLTACEQKATASNDAALNQAIAEAKTPAPVPGDGLVATVPQTGSTTRGTANSDTSIGAPKRGTTGTNAHN